LTAETLGAVAVDQYGDINLVHGIQWAGLGLAWLGLLMAVL